MLSYHFYFVGGSTHLNSFHISILIDLQNVQTSIEILELYSLLKLLYYAVCIDTKDKNTNYKYMESHIAKKNIVLFCKFLIRWRTTFKGCLLYFLKLASITFCTWLACVVSTEWNLISLNLVFLVKMMFHDNRIYYF